MQEFSPFSPLSSKPINTKTSSGNSELSFVTAGSLASFIEKQLPTTAFAIQAFVEPKGDLRASLDAGQFSNFRTVMSLDRTGRHSTQCYRLGAPTGFNTTQRRDVEAFRGALVRSMDQAVNRPLEKQTMSLVRTLEGVRRCRVRKMVTDWVVDPSGTPWFVKSEEVLTVSGKNKREAREAREAAARAEKRRGGRSSRRGGGEKFVSISSGGKVGASSSLPSVGGGGSQQLNANERAMSAP